MSDKTILWDERALETVQAMHTRVCELENHFGPDSPQHLKALTTYAKVMAQIVTFGFGPEARVARDGDLSLYVVENGFHYGVIWFRDRTYDGQDVPQPGSWSVHS